MVRRAFPAPGSAWTVKLVKRVNLPKERFIWIYIYIYMLYIFSWVDIEGIYQHLFNILRSKMPHFFGVWSGRSANPLCHTTILAVSIWFHHALTAMPPKTMSSTMKRGINLFYSFLLYDWKFTLNKDLYTTNQSKKL